MLTLWLLDFIPLHPDINQSLKQIYINLYYENLRYIVDRTISLKNVLLVKHAIVLHDSKFARTGYHDEMEWIIYKYIVETKGIYVERCNYTGLDSSIRILEATKND